MDSYIPGNYKWKESSLGNISITDVKAESSNGKMTMLYMNNEWRICIYMAIINIYVLNNLTWKYLK